MDKKKSISTYLPAFGVKGWIIAIFGIIFYYFYQGPVQVASNFYFAYFEAVYGWTNTQISTAITLGLLVGVAGIFVWGPAQKKLGSKKLAIVGLLGAAVTNLIFGFAPSMATLYVSVIGFAFFSVAYSQMAVANFAANWFPRTRGMYMGMATMGLTLSGATFTLLTSKIVPALGLTAMMCICSGVMAAAAILVALLAKDTPEEAGAWPDNDRTVSREELMAEAAAAAEYKKNSPWTVGAVLRCPYTWTIGIGWGLCMMTAGGFLGQLVPTLVSFGHDPNMGIILLSTMWPTGVLGNWLGGVVDNRFGTKAASITFVILEIAACVTLAFFGESKLVATCCTGVYMASMSACSNVTVSMVTNVFGRHDFENAWPVVSVPYKIIESFGVLVVSIVAMSKGFQTCYLTLAGVLVVSMVLMFLTTSKTIGSQIHGSAAK